MHSSTRAQGGTHASPRSAGIDAGMRGGLGLGVGVGRGMHLCPVPMGIGVRCRCRFGLRCAGVGATGRERSEAVRIGAKGALGRGARAV